MEFGDVINNPYICDSFLVDLVISKSSLEVGSILRQPLFVYSRLTLRHKKWAEAHIIYNV